MADFGARGLFGRGLDLVAVGEGWEDGGEEVECDARQPEGEALDDERADEFDGGWRVGSCDMRPRQRDGGDHCQETAAVRKISSMAMMIAGFEDCYIRF